MRLSSPLFWVVQTGLCVSLLILPLIAVRPLVRRWIGSRATASLWLILAVCLLVPWPSVWHWNLPPGWSSVVEDSRGRPAGEPVVRVSVEPASGTGNRGSQSSDVSPTGQPSSPSPSGWRPPGSGVWEALWLAGAVVAVAHLAAGWVRTRRWASEAAPAPDDSLPAQVFAAIPERYRRGVTLRLTDVLDVPALAGVWRPQVWLPRAWVHTLDADELRHVLLHELGHARRRDLLAQSLCSLACCLHWFNPLVWTLAAAARADRELACDAWVLARGGADPGGVLPAAYGRTLIKIATRWRAPAAWRQPLSAVAMAAGKDRLDLRVREISAFRPLPRWRGAGVSMLTAALAGVLATRDAAAPPDSGKPTPVPATTPADAVGKQVAPGIYAGTRLPARRSSMPEPVPPERRAGIPADRLALEFESKTIAFSAQAIGELKAQGGQSPAVAELIAQLAASIAESPKDPDAKPAGFSVTQIVSDHDLQEIVRRLNQCKGVDLLSAPRVTAKPGQKATVEIVREFPYATKFSRQNDPSGKPMLTLTEAGKKNIGVTLAVEGELSPARDAVDLNVSWQTVDLRGFVRTSDGKAIATADYKNDDERPVFSTQILETVVTMPPGSTLVLGSARHQPGSWLGLPIDETLKTEGTVLTLVTVNVVELLHPRPAEEEEDPSDSPAPDPDAASSPAGTPGVRTDGKKRPSGVPVPGKPGYFTSPYAPNAGYVDLRDFRSGQEVRDPYTGKLFLVP